MTEKELCKHLGVTPSGLKVLAKAAAQPDGQASGRGFGMASGAARQKLRRDGFVRERDYALDMITPAGRDVVAKARDLGW